MESEAMEYQTCVLKVPIHCEGCKKKVKKALSKIPGVLHTDIDSKLNKVTVTGSVDADTILKKLLKSNKLVELWPDEKPIKPNPKSDPNTSNESKQKKNKSAVKFQENPDKQPSLSEEPAATPAPESAAAPAAESGDAPKASEAAAKPKMAETESVAEAVAPAEPKNGPPEKVADGPASESAPKAACSKKKGKKAQKKTAEDGEESDGSEQTTENKTRATGGGSSAPVQRAVYEQPMYQTQPVHAYNMARPTTSSSFYAPAPVPAPMPLYEPHPYAYSSQQSYAYSSHPAQPESHYSQNSHAFSSHPAQPEPYYSQNSHAYSSHPAQPESHYSRNSQPDSYYSPFSAYPPPEPYHHHAEQAPPPAGSYDMFSDENPNACKVM